MSPCPLCHPSVQGHPVSPCPLHALPPQTSGTALSPCPLCPLPPQGAGTALIPMSLVPLRGAGTARVTRSPTSSAAPGCRAAPSPNPLHSWEWGQPLSPCPLCHPGVQGHPMSPGYIPCPLCPATSGEGTAGTVPEQDGDPAPSRLAGLSVSSRARGRSGAGTITPVGRGHGGRPTAATALGGRGARSQRSPPAAGLAASGGRQRGGAGARRARPAGLTPISFYSSSGNNGRDIPCGEPRRHVQQGLHRGQVHVQHRARLHRERRHQGGDEGLAGGARRRFCSSPRVPCSLSPLRLCRCGRAPPASPSGRGGRSLAWG